MYFFQKTILKSATKAQSRKERFNIVRRVGKGKFGVAAF